MGRSFIVSSKFLVFICTVNVKFCCPTSWLCPRNFNNIFLIFYLSYLLVSIFLKASHCSVHDIQIILLENHTVFQLSLQVSSSSVRKYTFWTVFIFFKYFNKSTKLKANNYCLSLKYKNQINPAKNYYNVWNT